MGESGSGKTTLISLLQHIYPIQEGRIRIGDYDIAQIDNRSLRRRVGTVPQQIELFAGSIAENIAVGDLYPDMKKIVDLTEQLGLKEFIDGLPKEYRTYIGEHGASLSGGERQRLAIARALYKEPEILIFDEATSSLDSISERYVKQTLDALAQRGKTIIVIAHRLSTVKNADRIVVIDKGQVVETGTHEELFDSGGMYCRLWKDVVEGRVTLREVCCKTDNGYERSVRSELSYLANGVLESKNVYHWDAVSHCWRLSKSYFYTSASDVELITYDKDGKTVLTYSNSNKRKSL